jgi:ABC-type polysaccharide/polyol phosphate export permease
MGQDNRPGPWRRLHLAAVFAWLGIVEYARSVAMVLMHIVTPWLMLLMLFPFAQGVELGSAPPTTVLHGRTAAEAPADARAADRALATALDRTFWVAGGSSAADAAERRFERAGQGALVSVEPAPASTATPAPGDQAAPDAGAESPRSTVTLTVRDGTDPIWPVVERVLETPVDTATGPPILLAPVTMPETGLNAAAFAGFFAILLILNTAGALVQVMTDRTDNWRAFLRVAPVNPALPLTGLSVGRLAIGILGVVYQWYVIDWTIGWPDGMQAGGVALLLGLGYAVSMILAVVVGMVLPAFHGAKDMAPGLVWPFLLLTPIIWSPGVEGGTLSLVTLLSPFTPVLDGLRAGFGLPGHVLDPLPALAFCLGWLASLALLAVLLGRRLGHRSRLA